LVKASESGFDGASGDTGVQRIGRSRMFYPVC